MTDTVQIDNLIEELGKITIALAQIAGDLPTPKAYKADYIYNGNITRSGNYDIVFPSGYTFDDLKAVYLEVCFINELNPENLFFTKTAPIIIGAGQSSDQFRLVTTESSQLKFDFITWTVFRRADLDISKIMINQFQGGTSILSVRPVGIFY